MAARKATRVFPGRIYSTKLDKNGAEIGWIEAGQPVPLDHLSDADYKTINDLYPAGMTADEADAMARDRADAAAVAHGAKEK